MIYQIGNMGGYPFTIAEEFRKNGIEAMSKREYVKTMKKLKDV